MKLSFLVLLLAFSAFASEDLIVLPIPPTPPVIHACVVTNIIMVDTNQTILTNAFVAAVKIEAKNCPKIWYYGIVNGERRQWCVHDHEAAGFEVGFFESGITHLWKTSHYIPDLMVIKVKEQQPRVWKIPAQASK